MTGGERLRAAADLAREISGACMGGFEADVDPSWYNQPDAEEQIDARTLADLTGRDLGKVVNIPDCNAEGGRLLSVEHFTYEGKPLVDVSLTRWGGMVLSPTTACEVAR